MQQPNSDLRPPSSHIRTDLLQQGSRLMLLISGVCLLTAVVMVIWPGVLSEEMQAVSNLASWFATRTETATLRRTDRPLVGIVAGHAGYDPGAVCPDGLTEAEVNLRIAEEVVKLLRRRGIETNLLEEFDARLANYQANALVSIHADSCNVPGVTGFKVARVTLSAIPEAEDHLVTCLINEYGKITRLPEHPASITDGMTNYHAFREIASQTPGAIIETGFLLEDRTLLERNPRLAARGVAAGILCFLASTDDG